MEDTKREIFIADLCHLVWQYFERKNGLDVPTSPSKEQFDSILAGIEAMDKNPNMTPEESHENWMKHKIQNGWKYGLVKNSEAKTHPDIRPYSELPKAEQDKNKLFIQSYHTGVSFWNDLHRSKEN